MGQFYWIVQSKWPKKQKRKKKWFAGEIWTNLKEWIKLKLSWRQNWGNLLPRFWIQIILVLVFILSRYWFKSIIRIPRPPKKQKIVSIFHFPFLVSFSFFGPILKKFIKNSCKSIHFWRRFSAFLGAKKCRFCERFPNYSVYFSSEKCTIFADLFRPKNKRTKNTKRAERSEARWQKQNNKKLKYESAERSEAT